MISMIVLIIYKKSIGESILPTSYDIEQSDHNAKSTAQTNPAFQLSDDL